MRTEIKRQFEEILNDELESINNYNTSRINIFKNKMYRELNEYNGNYKINSKGIFYIINKNPKVEL